MRQIKFKVRFKIKQYNESFKEEEIIFLESKTHEIYSLCIHGNHVVVPYNNTVLTIFQNECECIDILQFTGLTDKNGKEIYEGDIVKWNDSSDNECWRFAIVEINPDIQFECSNIPEVDGIQNSISYCFKYASFFYRDTAKFLEVIGNIHDNPELLNPQ